MMSIVNWAFMSPAECFFALLEAPSVAGPWREREGEHVRLDVRDAVIARIAIRTAEDLPVIWGTPLDSGHAATLEEAKAAADAVLVAENWRLV